MLPAFFSGKRIGLAHQTSSTPVKGINGMKKSLGVEIAC
jgi:hypothetical protein